MVWFMDVICALVSSAAGKAKKEKRDPSKTKTLIKNSYWNMR